ncbi:MAG: hypothetical protein FWC64_05765 [Treponema sp.]|nr:hypothetical protein [Treponema sp.]
MKKKITIAISAMFALCMLTVAACVIDIPLTVTRGGWGPAEQPYDTGGVEVQGMAGGAAGGYGGRLVTVHIELEGGYITSFRFTGGYSPDWISTVNERRAGWERTVLNSNSFDFPVIGSGASYTLRGVRNAGRNALINNFESITEDDFTLND